MRVVEIFKSIEGEGIRAGFPCTFVRFEGCNLRCEYCDTKYSYENAVFTEMTPQEIYDAVFRMGCPKVTLTGGEPLIQEEISELISLLYQAGFEINIETNGSIAVGQYITHWPKLLITMDYKCPCSGMESNMNLDSLAELRKKDVLKFVVGSEKDLNTCRDLIKYTNAQVFISPVFGSIEPKDIVEYMLDHDMQSCRVQLQLHKFIWKPEERGV